MENQELAQDSQQALADEVRLDQEASLCKSVLFDCSIKANGNQAEFAGSEVVASTIAETLAAHEINPKVIGHVEQLVSASKARLVGILGLPHDSHHSFKTCSHRTT
jgi:hypothetical protein